MDKTIILLLITSSIFFSCKKSTCDKISGTEIVNLPPPYENMFADIPQTSIAVVYVYCSCKSNNGQSETASLMGGNPNGYYRQDYGVTSDCKNRTGAQKFNYFSTSINGYDFYYEVTFKEQDQVFFKFRCSLNSLDNKKVDWTYTSILNYNTNNITVHYTEGYNADSLISDSDKFTLIGPQTIDSIYYPEVYKLDMTFSKKHCKPYSIGTVFFDKRKGAVKYILNNGTEWYVKY